MQRHNFYYILFSGEIMINSVTDIDGDIPVRNVLISVSDKRGLEDFVKDLIEINPGIKIYSTGGTYDFIKNFLGEKSCGNLVRISEYTKQPEMQGGLVKTLDFKIYLGILSETYNEVHKKDIERTGAVVFDMIVANLYPFEKTIAEPDSDLEAARGNIDIGGPSMLRASAKNFLRVASVVDPGDYPSIIKSLRKNSGKLSFAERFDLAKSVFRHTAAYDSAISGYLDEISGKEAAKIYNFH